MTTSRETGFSLRALLLLLAVAAVLAALGQSTVQRIRDGWHTPDNMPAAVQAVMVLTALAGPIVGGVHGLGQQRFQLVETGV